MPHKGLVRCAQKTSDILWINVVVSLVDKCPPWRYNSFKVLKEVANMTAHFSSVHHASYCCTGAAAAASARIYLVLDTVILAVSILVALSLLGLQHIL